jgi:pimeloyl-ACP methyl ester carboxylesterase
VGAIPVEPFEVGVPEATLADLRERLRRTRWPPDVGNADWRYGTERGYLEELVGHWLDRYDWREHERAMNAFRHRRAVVDGVPIHFLHEPGAGPDPLPLVLTHGWPWTFWDFQKVIRPLADPAAVGADPADAFEVVVPSLPGFGFSVPMTATGIDFTRTADLWVRLMRDALGHPRFAAAGGDWGALVSAQLGHAHAASLVGVHLSLALPLDLFHGPRPGPEEYAEDERHLLERTREAASVRTSHVAVQASDPQTLAYALHDSPVGLCAWMLERRRSWSDCDGDVERRFSKDDLITTTVLYWVTESLVSSARYYWEAAHRPWRPAHDRAPVVEAPTGVAMFPRELSLMPRAFLERYYDLRRVTHMPAGGHFAPMEEPELLVEDLRAFFRPLRAAR